VATEQTTLLFGRKGPKIGEIQLDANVRETPKYENEVTQYPIETGSDITDNNRILPDKLSIEGIVTNTPLEVTFQDITEQVDGDSNTSQAIINQRTGNPTFVEVAQNALLALTGRSIHGNIINDPQVISITTGLRVYPNMVISSLSFPRTAETGQALRVVIEAVAIETVNIEFIEIANPQASVKDKTQSKIDKGKKVTEKPEEEENISILAKVVNKIFKGTP